MKKLLIYMLISFVVYVIARQIGSSFDVGWLAGCFAVILMNVYDKVKVVRED
jgi:hypothetical protein